MLAGAASGVGLCCSCTGSVGRVFGCVGGLLAVGTCEWHLTELRLYRFCRSACGRVMSLADGGKPEGTVGVCCGRISSAGKFSACTDDLSH